MQSIEKSIQVISEQLSNIMEEQMKGILEIDNQINQVKVDIYSRKTSAKQKDELLDRLIDLLAQRDGMFAPFGAVQETMYKTMQHLENLKWSKLHRFNVRRDVAKIEKYIIECANKVIAQVESDISNSAQTPIQPIEGVKDVIKEVHEEREKEAKKEKVGK